MSDPVTPQAASQAPILATSLDEAIKVGARLMQVASVAGHKPVLTAPHIKEGVFQLVPEKLDAPRFLTAAPTFHDAKAFIDYLNAMKGAASRIFYTEDGDFLAVLDYHRSPFISRTDDLTNAAHGDHTARLVLKRSPEWETWMAKNCEQFSQGDFAEFLEDNLSDIIEPDAADILAVANGLSAAQGATFRSARNQADGTMQLQYDETIDAKVQGTSKSIPTTFKLGLRPFVGCARYPIECRLRYRLPSGNLRFHYKTLRTDPITEDAVGAVVERIRDEAGITPALGTHDAKAFARGQ